MYASTRSRNLTETYTVKARKEVIIAAGTIHTPQILQASGVGPKAVLDAANVTVVVDLPGVGQNFQDHPLPTSLRFTCKPRLSRLYDIADISYVVDNFTMHPNPNDILTNTTFIAQAQAEFAANRTGMSSSIPLTSVSDYERLNLRTLRHRVRQCCCFPPLPYNLAG